MLFVTHSQKNAFNIATLTSIFDKIDINKRVVTFFENKLILLISIFDKIDVNVVMLTSIL